MKNSMISFLTAIILTLMIQPGAAQNLPLEKGVTHPHAISMINVSPMFQLAEECMQLCRGEETHHQVGEQMTKMPETMDKKSGHMAMMNECPMMNGDEESADSDDHDDHH